MVVAMPMVGGGAGGRGCRRGCGGGGAVIGVAMIGMTVAGVVVATVVVAGVVVAGPAMGIVRHVGG